MRRFITFLLLMTSAAAALADTTATVTVSNFRYELVHTGTGSGPLLTPQQPRPADVILLGRLQDSAPDPDLYRESAQKHYGSSSDDSGFGTKYSLSADTRGGPYISSVASRSDGTSDAHVSAYLNDSNVISFYSGYETHATYYADVHIQARIEPGQATEEQIYGYVIFYAYGARYEEPPTYMTEFQIDYSAVGGTNSDSLWIDETRTLVLPFIAGESPTITVNTMLSTGSAMAVPEPATWGMLLSGLLLLRRRSRRAQAAALPN